MTVVTESPDGPRAVPVGEFLRLRATGQRTYVVPVALDLCSGLRTLWGGCGLAAAVEAMQRSAGRPCAWAAVQYLRPIHPGQELVLEVTQAAGRRLTQSQVTGTVDGEVVLVGHGSLGGGGETDHQFVSPPDGVPPPEECAARSMPLRVDPAGTILTRFEQRWAGPEPALREDGSLGTGRTLVWMRLREPVETGAAALAVLADLAPSAISEALGEMAGGVSLDNTIRYARAGDVPPGGWVLLDLAVEAVVADVAQIAVRVFDTAGTLLAVGGQSAVVRRVAAPRSRPPV